MKSPLVPVRHERPRGWVVLVLEDGSEWHGKGGYWWEARTGGLATDEFADHLEALSSALAKEQSA